jgi:hypothetical protein
MKALFPSAILALAFIFNACGDGQRDAALQIAAAADSLKVASTVDLGEFHMPLVLVMPEGMPPAMKTWKDELGELSISAGDHFNLSITEGPADRDRLKGDLDRDLLRKNTIVEETPDLLVYRSEFPDDSSLVFFHFNKTITVDGRTFTAMDGDTGTPFSLEDVKRMAGSIGPKLPA